MYSAITVAKYLIKFSTEQGTPVSNLRLQKVLYFVQAEFMVTNEEPCFGDIIEAWDLGPVVPTVYRTYKVFGASSIPANDDMSGEETISAKDMDTINGIVDQCNEYSTSALVEITHRQDPWIKAHNSRISKIISPQSLYEYFKEA